MSNYFLASAEVALAWALPNRNCSAVGRRTPLGFSSAVWMASVQKEAQKFTRLFLSVPTSKGSTSLFVSLAALLAAAFVPKNSRLHGSCLLIT